MGKDREGKFHPLKGKPSDTSKEGTELKEMTGTDVHVRHPNRQTHKGKEKTKPAEEGSLKTWDEKTYAQDRVDTAPEELDGVLSKDLLKELAEYRSGCCITIVLPTHRSGMEVNEQHDLILYKNILQDVKKQLEEKNTDPVKIERILEPAFELLRNNEFWRNQGEGLALFIADNYFKYIRLPFTPEQECIVNNAFYLINLVRLLNTNATDQFYLLFIRRDKTKLFKADARGVREVESDDMPSDINSVINLNGEDKGFLQNEEGENTDSPEHVSSGRPEKVITGVYVEKIDRAFRNIAPPETSWPLMLAGQEELLKAFRKTSQYENIMKNELVVDDEHAGSRELFQQARQKIEEKMREEMNDRLETYYNSIITNLTSSMPEHVIPACYYSQVRVLFVEKGAHIWGHFNQQDNKLEMHAERSMDDDCLIEKAAIQTILHGGEVFILEKEKMPKGATIAALLRYAQ